MTHDAPPTQPATPPVPPDAVGTTGDQLHARAIARLKKKRDFAAHVLVYTLFNGFLVVIWALTSDGGFFWPVFLIAGWGIGLVMNAWDVWRGSEFTEAEVSREIERIKGRDSRR